MDDLNVTLDTYCVVLLGSHEMTTGIAVAAVRSADAVRERSKAVIVFEVQNVV